VNWYWVAKAFGYFTKSRTHIFNEVELDFAHHALDQMLHSLAFYREIMVYPSLPSILKVPARYSQNACMSFSTQKQVHRTVS
jgi:hypothetical protein